MDTLDPSGVLKLIEEASRTLEDVAEPLHLRIGGGIAVAFHLAAASRTTDAAARRTLDCDIVSFDPLASAPRLERLLQGAEDLAAARGLPPSWLNAEAKRFAYLLPTGWTHRVVLAGDFGTVRVEMLGRVDLMAMKLMSDRRRVNDEQDLFLLGPTEQESRFLEAHVQACWSEDRERDDERFQSALDLLRELRPDDNDDGEGEG